MRGGFLHNRVLVEAIALLLLELGAPFQLEYPVRLADSVGFADVFAVHGSLRIVCEIELTADRVWNDVAKAVALQANLLLIVTPTGAVARRIRKCLRYSATQSVPGELEICVLPFGKALQWLRNKLSLMTAVNVRQTTNQQFDEKLSGRGKIYGEHSR